MQTRNNYRNEDVTGERFGRLVAIEKVKNKRTQWVFRCDCGNTIVLPYSRILYGQHSCGCMRKETAKKWVKSNTKHNCSRTKLYRKYRAMIDRCYNKNVRNYNRYGGRGIFVCEEWKNSFEAFQEWAYKSGYDPNLDGRIEQSLDRIDNDREYSPENCKWSTAKEQQKNKECSRLYEYKGKYYTSSEFADTFGISCKSFVYRRLDKGQTLEYILNDWTRIHNVPEGLIDTVDFAKSKNVDPATVKRWINKGLIQGEKVGRKWYVRP